MDANAPSNHTNHYNEVQTRILDVAEVLFADLGFEGTSTRTLATKADVNQAMISYYFGGKAQLLTAVLKRRMDTGATMIQSTLAKDLPFIDRLDLIIEGYTYKVTASRYFTKLVQTEMANHNRSDAMETISRVFCNNRRLLVEFVQDGIDAKEFQYVDAHLFVHSLISTIIEFNMNPKLSHLFLSDNSDSVFEDASPEVWAAYKVRIIAHLQKLSRAMLMPVL